MIFKILTIMVCLVLCFSTVLYLMNEEKKNDSEILGGIFIIIPCLLAIINALY